jgi:hypothetical protein
MVVVCEPAAGRIIGRRRGAVLRGPLCLGCSRVVLELEDGEMEGFWCG